MENVVFPSLMLEVEGLIVIDKANVFIASSSRLMVQYGTLAICVRPC
jgi:hypothetical protein